MSGFPSIHSRAAFGPTYVQERKVRNPKAELSDHVLNLTFHQVAGMNLISAKAWFECHYDGVSDVVLDGHAEAWNVDQKTAPPYDPPIITRSGVGLYQANYAATYPDMNGNAVAIDIDKFRWSARPSGTNAIPMIAFDKVDANTVDIRTYEWIVGSSSDWGLSDIRFAVWWG